MQFTAKIWGKKIHQIDFLKPEVSDCAKMGESQSVLFNMEAEEKPDRFDEAADLEVTDSSTGEIFEEESDDNSEKTSSETVEDGNPDDLDNGEALERYGIAEVEERGDILKKMLNQLKKIPRV